MPVRIVTDSTCDLPTRYVEEYGIGVVPLTISFGDEAFLDGVEMDADAFYERMAAFEGLPRTSQPAVERFQQVYETLAGETGEIASVHISSRMSGTLNSAAVAREAVAPAVRVDLIDSYSVSLGLGAVVLEAARTAARGASLPEVTEAARREVGRVHVVAVVDTLEYLRRGGRIGGAQALLGTMLKFKPVISLQDGVVEPVTRVRTRPKALQYIADVVAKDSDTIERLVVISGDAPDTDRFVSMLESSVKVPPSDVWSFGPIVGAHAGPGIMGVAYLVRG